MIDIHCHVLYGVDDGPKDREESIQMLKAAKEQGIDAMILTPHYRKEMFAYPKEIIEAHFEDLKAVAKKLDVKIYLGTEYHVNSFMVENFRIGRCKTLADTEYVLAEYSYGTEYSQMKASIQELLFTGYIPIIAHAERYECLRNNVNRVEELRDFGAMIQVNADAVIGQDGFGTKQYVKKLLKNRLVDFVASDSHGLKKRVNNLSKCRDYLYKKYSYDYVDEILVTNAKRIINVGEK